MLKQIKTIYTNYFILITICLFVVVYYIMNRQEIQDEQYSFKSSMKPALITIGITLILYLLLGCNDNTEDNSYSLFDTTPATKTYKIVNKYDADMNIPKNEINLLRNPFISQQDATKKFGIRY